MELILYLSSSQTYIVIANTRQYSNKRKGQTPQKCRIFRTGTLRTVSGQYLSTIHLLILPYFVNVCC